MARSDRRDPIKPVEGLQYSPSHWGADAHSWPSGAAIVADAGMGTDEDVAHRQSTLAGPKTPFVEQADTEQASCG